MMVVCLCDLMMMRWMLGMVVVLCLKAKLSWVMRETSPGVLDIVGWLTLVVESVQYESRVCQTRVRTVHLSCGFGLSSLTTLILEEALAKN